MNRLVWATLCVISTPLVAPDDPGPARAKGVTIRYEAPSFVVRGIDDENLRALAKADWDPDRWSETFSLSVASHRSKPLPIAGTHRIVGDALRFEPRYPLDPGLDYVAKFDPSRLPVARDDGSSRTGFRLPPARKAAPASVSRVEPSGDVLPENLLKFYLHFSAPMSRGEVYRRVRLTDAKGRTLDHAFLEIGEELWDPSGTRITLLLDPGRIKRGLRPREEEGPILEAGKSYALVVDREWPDASGQAMRDAYRKVFRAGPAQMRQLDTKEWVITTPTPQTRDSVVVTFPQPLDHALLDHALVVLDSKGARVAGRASIVADSTRWEFTPAVEWTAGTYQLEIDADLEDLAGNSRARAFEVDVEGQVGVRNEVRRVRLPIKISAAPRP